MGRLQCPPVWDGGGEADYSRACSTQIYTCFAKFYPIDPLIFIPISYYTVLQLATVTII